MPDLIHNRIVVEVDSFALCRWGINFLMISFNVNALLLNNLLQIWARFCCVPEIAPAMVGCRPNNVRRERLTLHQAKKSWREAIVRRDGLDRC